MRIPRVFVEQPLSPKITITLAPQTTHYLLRVLRLPDGAPITLFNGLGGEYSAILQRDGKTGLRAITGTFEPVNRSAPINIQLAIVISRGERMDWVVQKATELGVARLTPLFSERCEVRLDSRRLDKKLDHWRKVAISACEQSGLNQVPQLHRPTRLSDWLDSATDPLKLILHPGSASPFTRPDMPNRITLLVGPEGGFSDGEVALARQHEFLPLQLGPRILRTETAPVVALSILQHRWGDLGGALATAANEQNPQK